ncbi:N-acetylmuramoyl-L-alanine amidase [Streptomyces spinoverrucosus]|uniref:N-acetylmuramoyl-L-alanine amidase n=2 Tax=Streptomyces spinoverrucosus TaxID=284043 RepID=UPI001671E6EA|nr:N-acetylmuramoyl-L-alanine amidase [Streptomyces spinoverrucosus]GHC00270.1 hypothetical protein GCM10010397_85210 [Streptomyces spinoverrucosus]
MKVHQVWIAVAVGSMANAAAVGVAQAAESQGKTPAGSSTHHLSLQGGEATEDLPNEHSTKPFSLLGVSWDNPDTELPGTVEVRTRDARTGSWSSWFHLEGHGHGGDEGTTAARGSSDPVWVGPSNGVQLRTTHEGKAAAKLPAGARLDLVDPGADSGSVSAEPGAGEGQPPIVSRAGWGADETLLPPGAEPGDPSNDPEYNAEVKAIFVHHTAGTNDYSCDESPAIIRAIHRYHVVTNGWKDVGYNFMVDKCGTIFEGRKGGTDKPVLGAHTYGFNRESSGIGVLGNHAALPASQEALASVAAVSAWKLGQYGGDPAGTAELTTTVTQENYFGKQYTVGNSYTFERISSHRDGVNVDCAGDKLYEQLPAIRQLASELGSVKRAV